MGKDSKPKESGGKGKGKQAASGSDENASKGKGKGGKGGDSLGTCTYVKARHVLCEKQGKINEAYKKLQDGWLSNGDKVPPAEFAKVAQEYSECPSGKKGGDLGWFPRGKMAGPFQDVAFSTPIGATSAPFKSTYSLGLLSVVILIPYNYYMSIHAPSLLHLGRSANVCLNDDAGMVTISSYVKEERTNT
ncbi:peptidyl-prolyl cis-trans isomerase NIMA-interacting 4 isoform X1 [Abrus precatorius]|uniref:Peptidyl-prolyl cis-trans isomerase n=1 Tax=Abrus precatorius TaxID=3816 RepID=A0A8B8K5H9_ABRPR|nr:peptidyl-prolyl cis-trans isomerase NIMA-interacting 4 isoform X1 [Abrus precatorius]